MATLASSGDAPQTSLSVQVEPTLQQPEGGLDDLPRGHRSLFHVSPPSPNGKCSPVTTTCARDLPVPALQVADLDVAGLVVDEVVAGRAVPAGLEKGVARSVPGGFRRVDVPVSPVRQHAQRPGELGALGGQLVGGPGRPLRVGPGNQQPFPLQPLEALGEDIRGDPGDLAEEVIDPLWPTEQRLDHQ